MKLVKQCISAAATLMLAAAIAHIASVPGVSPSLRATVSTRRSTTDSGGKTNASVIRSPLGPLACDNGSDTDNDGDGDDSGSDDAGGY